MPEGDNPADGKQDGAGAPQAGDPPKPGKTFTQDELDAIVTDRLRRAVPKDYEELKAKAAKADEAEEAKKSELQKAKDEAKAAKDASAERESRANAKLRRAAILEEAGKQKAIDGDVVVALLTSDATITVDDDGNVAGVTEAVKKLLKDKPVLVAQAGGRPEFGGNDPKSNLEKIAKLERDAQDPKLSHRERSELYAEARRLKLSGSTGS